MSIERSDLLFAPARPGDADAMGQLARAAYGMYVERMGREPAPMTADYDAVAASGDALLVWRGSELIGMLVSRLDADAVDVENLAVSPVAQGRGLGSILLASAELRAVETGRHRVRLYTNAAMTENLAYYPRRGFTEIDRRTVEGYHRVYFEKHLTD